jgi:SulP family sulfate permease
MASLTTGGVVVLTLLVLAPLFSDLPNAVLAAIIIEAVVMGMMDVPAMRRLYRVNRPDFWIALAAILGVLGAGVLAGVVIGVALSLLLLIYAAASPRMPELGRRPGSQAFVSLDAFPDSETFPGVLVLRFDSDLYYATSDALQDGIREQVLDAQPPLHAVVLDLEGVDFVDSQGTEAVGKLLDLGGAAGIELRLARVKRPVAEMLERDGVIARLGEGRVFATVYEAVADLIPREAS